MTFLERLQRRNKLLGTPAKKKTITLAISAAIEERAATGMSKTQKEKDDDTARLEHLRMLERSA